MKNKVVPPFKVAEVELMYGQGISRVSELIDLGVEMDLIQKAVSWYDYNNGELKAQRKEPMKKVLLNNPEKMKEIEEKIRRKLDGEELIEEDSSVDLFSDDPVSVENQTE